MSAHSHILFLLLTVLISYSLVTVAKEKSTKETAGRGPPLDLVPVCQLGEIHKANNRTEHRSLVLLIIQQVRSLPDFNYKTARAHAPA